VRSASALILVPVLLAGCATTQDRNERAKLDAQRFLAGRRPVTVTAPNPDVRVGKVVLLHHDGAAAVVVELRNTSDAPLTDLPVSVGLQQGGRRIYLNRRASYFNNHVAALAPGRAVAWAYTTRKAKRLEGQPFAVVGRPAEPRLSVATALPAIEVAPASGLGPTVTARVRNDTGVPQYTLPVYAFARRGSRYTAAARVTLHHLGTGQERQVRLSLIGSTGGAQVSFQTQPSMFE
jgi:hypothetical protein